MTSAMTNEEAIRELKEYVRYCDEEFDTPFDKAIRFAIKALEQEPIREKMANAKETTWLTDGLTEEEIAETIRGARAEIKKPCEDAVSRREVIKEIDKYSKTTYKKDLNDVFKVIKMLVELMPSVNPTREHGELKKTESLCDSCENLGCNFQQGIVRKECSMYYKWELSKSKRGDTDAK